MTKEEAQLALANLKRYMSGGGSVDKGTNRAIDMAIEALSQPELHWIPVEQGLPQIGECVLCKTTARYFGKYHVCKFVDKDNWVDKPHFDWDTHGFPYVIAWARFEPYEEVTT